MPKMVNIKNRINIEKVMLFFFLNISMIQIVTSKIGSFTSDRILTSSILSQIVIGVIIISWCKSRRIQPISLMLPLSAICLFLMSAVIFPNRIDSILSRDGGLLEIISMYGGLMAFFITSNLINYKSIESVIYLSMFYQVPYYLYICSRTRNIGYWVINIGGQMIESSYNMAVGYEMAFVSVVLMFLFYKNKKVIYVILSLLFELLILLYGSRGALFPLILFIIMWYMIVGNSKEAKVKKILIFLIAFIAGVVIVRNINVIAEGINDFFYTKLNYYSRTLDRFIDGELANSSTRIELWKTIYKSLKENLFLPLGLYADRELLGTYSHNIFIEIFSNFGVFGIGLLLLLSIGYVCFLVKCKNEHEKMFLTLFMSVGIVKLMLSSSFWVERYFWIFIGLLYVGYKNCDKSDINKATVGK